MTNLLLDSDYVDEFQNFVVSSFEKILSEAGKAGLTLVMANQFLEQLGENLPTAIRSNTGTLVSFRVSAQSGRVLEGEFGGLFGAKELTDLERGQAVARIGRAGDSFLLRTFPPLQPETVGADTGAPERIRGNSHTRVCRERQDVEAELRASDEALHRLLAEAADAQRRAREKPAKGSRERAAAGSSDSGTGRRVEPVQEHGQTPDQAEAGTSEVVETEEEPIIDGGVSGNENSRHSPRRQMLRAKHSRRLRGRAAPGGAPSDARPAENGTELRLVAPSGEVLEGGDEAGHFAEVRAVKPTAPGDTQPVSQEPEHQEEPRPVREPPVNLEPASAGKALFFGLPEEPELHKETSGGGTQGHS